jgi:hypothetical protein
MYLLQKLVHQFIADFRHVVATLRYNFR